MLIYEDSYCLIHRVSPEDGLRAAGIQISKTGRAQGRASVRVGSVERKRYTVRRRAGDGRTVYRWGRLIAAEITTLKGGETRPDGGVTSQHTLVTFIPDRAANQLNSP